MMGRINKELVQVLAMHNVTIFAKEVFKEVFKEVNKIM
jgi:hypothetical protein